MDPIQILATIAALSLVVKGVVDALRRQYPSLDGGVVQLIAVALGIGVAVALDIRGTLALLDSIGAGAGRVPISAVDYVITGVAIAFGAGALAEAVGRSGAKANPVLVEVNDEGQPV